MGNTSDLTVKDSKVIATETGFSHIQVKFISGKLGGRSKKGE